jgi:hypothetical protein
MNKDRDIPRNGDVWVYFEGGQYKIIDIAKIQIQLLFLLI